MDPNGQNSATTGAPTPPVDPQPVNNSLPPVDEGTPHPFGAEAPTTATPPTPEPIPEAAPADVSAQTEPPVNDAIVPPPSSNGNKSKMKVAGAILGVLLLVGSVVAGVTLVQRNQETREKASSPQISGNPVIDPNEIPANTQTQVSFTAIGENGTGTEEITIWLKKDGQLTALGSTRGNDPTNPAWKDNAGLNLPAGEYEIVFIPTTSDGIQGERKTAQIRVGGRTGDGQARPGSDPGDGGLPRLGATDFSPRRTPANTTTRISYTAVGTNGATEVVVELKKNGQLVQKLDSTFANDGNNPAWQNSAEVDRSKLTVGMYKLVFTPMKAGTPGTPGDIDFEVYGEDTTSTDPQIIDAPSASPGTFVANQASKITICASGNGDKTSVIVAKLYKLGVEAPVATLGNTWDKNQNRCNEVNWPANIAEGNYAIKFMPQKGSTSGSERTYEPIKVTAAGSPGGTAASDARCTLIQTARGGSDVSPSQLKVGETINVVVYCYTNDTSDDFDKIRVSVTAPSGSQTRDLSPTRVQAKDVGTNRFFQVSLPLTISSAGNYTIKAWGHTPAKGWKGKE